MLRGGEQEGAAGTHAQACLPASWGICPGDARMVSRASVWVLGAATNLLAASLMRAPPCPAVPSCPTAPACPTLLCPNLSCGEVHCWAAEEPLTCPAAPPAPPPPPVDPPAPEPAPAPAEPLPISDWSWAALLLGHVVLASIQLWRGLLGIVRSLLCRRHGRHGATAVRRPALGTGAVSRRAVLAPTESLGQIGESSSRER